MSGLLRLPRPPLGVAQGLVIHSFISPTPCFVPPTLLVILIAAVRRLDARGAGGAAHRDLGVPRARGRERVSGREIFKGRWRVRPVPAIFPLSLLVHLSSPPNGLCHGPVPSIRVKLPATGLLYVGCCDSISFSACSTMRALQCFSGETLFGRGAITHRMGRQGRECLT